MHQANSFITLTYSDANLPPDGSINLDHFQRFMKRLRKEFEGTTVRFFHCGEYGEKLHRPHYHAILFGIDFYHDRYPYKVINGHTHFRSPTLEKLWDYGYSDISDVTWSSAAYVARYITKKITGNEALDHYVDKETGVLRKAEYVTMSRRPGLANSWFKKYWQDVYPEDFVVIDGKQYKPPKYYDRLLEEFQPEMYQKVLDRRMEFGEDHADNYTTERLAVRKEAFIHRTKHLRRNYEMDGI